MDSTYWSFHIKKFHYVDNTKYQIPIESECNNPDCEFYIKEYSAEDHRSMYHDDFYHGRGSLVKCEDTKCRYYEKPSTGIIYTNTEIVERYEKYKPNKNHSGTKYQAEQRREKYMRK
jgi:hypothetical protein